MGRGSMGGRGPITSRFEYNDKFEHPIAKYTFLNENRKWPWQIQRNIPGEYSLFEFLGKTNGVLLRFLGYSNPEGYSYSAHWAHNLGGDHEYYFIRNVTIFIRIRSAVIKIQRKWRNKITGIWLLTLKNIRLYPVKYTIVQMLKTHVK